MGIERKTAVQVRELKDTLVLYPHIQEVFFTEAGEHFFTAHELVEKGKRTGKMYGYQKLKPVQVKTQGDRRVFKHESVHTPNTLITQTLSRDEVLSYEPDSPATNTKTPASVGKQK